MIIRKLFLFFFPYPIFNSIQFNMMWKIKQTSNPWNLSETRVLVPQPALTHMEAKCFCHIINSVFTRNCGSLVRGTLLWNAVPGNLTSALPPSTIFWRGSTEQKADCGLRGMVYITHFFVVWLEGGESWNISTKFLSLVAYKGQGQTTKIDKLTSSLPWLLLSSSKV